MLSGQAAATRDAPPSQNGYGFFFLGAARAACEPFTGSCAAVSSIDLDIVVRGMPCLTAELCGIV